MNVTHCYISLDAKKDMQTNCHACAWNLAHGLKHPPGNILKYLSSNGGNYTRTMLMCVLFNVLP